MCVLSIKVPIRKKSGNLFNDPCMIGITVSFMSHNIFKSQAKLNTAIKLMFFEMIDHHHHYQGVKTAQIPLIFSLFLSLSLSLSHTHTHHPSLLAIAHDTSSSWHSVFTQSWWSFYWSAITGVSMCGSPLESVIHEFVFISLAVSSFSYWDGLWDRM